MGFNNRRDGYMQQERALTLEEWSRMNGYVPETGTYEDRSVTVPIAMRPHWPKT
jgi:hypothetical protein